MAIAPQGVLGWRCGRSRAAARSGADPNQVAPTGWRQTPLGRTLEFRLTHPKHAGHWAVVRVLLEGGADATVRSTYLDMTPYELACVGGFQPAAELLREFQADAPAHPAGMTELWLAAASRLPEHTIGALADCVNVNRMWRKATPWRMHCWRPAPIRTRARPFCMPTSIERREFMGGL